MALTLHSSEKPYKTATASAEGARDLAWLGVGRRLSAKLIVRIVIFSSIITCIATFAQLYSEYARDVGLLESRMQQLEKSYRQSIAASLWAIDIELLKLQLQGIGTLPGIEYVEVIDGGDVLASSGGRPGEYHIKHTIPISYDYKGADIALGSLNVFANLDDVYAGLWDQAMVIFGTQAVKTFIFTSFIFLIFQYCVTRHLEHMSDQVRKLDSGNMGAALSLNRSQSAGKEKDELDHVVDAFNDMRARLQSWADKLGEENERRLKAERMAGIGEISACIAHEIRNPLSGIINALALIERAPAGRAETRELIELVKGETQRLQHILNDFLKFARPAPARIAPCQIAPVIRSVFDAVSLSLDDGKRIRFALDADDLSQEALCDHDQIRQVVWNIVLNAVQAMPTGGEVSATLRRDGDWLVISISDEGGGVPEDIRDRAQEPFVSGRQGGSGLGLAVASRILADHQSELRLEPRQDGPGTNASFRLAVV